MCGIVGFGGSLYSSRHLEKMIERACDKLHHRGPDDQGIYQEEGIALGASRLAIRDPAKGKQPMSRHGMTMVFNGELYDAQPLKRSLENKGYQFETDCDTEIFLLAFIEFGPALLSTLTGMFAFGLWDSKKKKLFLGRDRWGEKPLYYTCGHAFIAFASEIKAFHIFPNICWEIAEEDICLFLRNSYIPAPNTGWKNIYKLEQGSILSWQGGKLSKHRYFSPSLTKTPPHSFDESQELFSLLSSSTRSCAISERPVGVFLSGGIDSTTVACLLAQHLTNFPLFSIYWDDLDYTEEHYAKEAANTLGLQLNKIKCDSLFFKNNLDYLVDLYDEPFADESMVPTYCLAKFAKQQVDVVLTGDGADEFFHGYERYFFEGNLHHYFETFSAMDKNVRRMICTEEFIENDRQTHLYHLIDKFTEMNIESNPERIKSWIDINTYLPDNILTKVDRATMAAGLEARAPFLTPSITNFALSSSCKQLIGNGKRGKEILRLAMQNHLPKTILNRKKMGFGVPISLWFRTVLKEWMISRLTDGCLPNIGWFSQLGIKKLIDSHLSGQVNYSRAILNLIVLETWLRNQKSKI